MNICHAVIAVWLAECFQGMCVWLTGEQRSDYVYGNTLHTNRPINDFFSCCTFVYTSICYTMKSNCFTFLLAHRIAGWGPHPPLDESSPSIAFFCNFSHFRLFIPALPRSLKTIPSSPSSTTFFYFPCFLCQYLEDERQSWTFPI